MKKKTKTKKDFLNELRLLKRRISELEKLETDYKRSAKMLLESEQRFHNIADFTYDWMYFIGADGRFIYVSPSCERITGYSPDKFLKEPELMEKIAHPDDRELVENHLRKDFNRMRMFSIDFRIISRLGEERWISHICQPVYRIDGTIIGRLAVNRDITERKRTDEELKKYREHLEDMVEERAGEIKRINEQLRKEIAERLHAEWDLRIKDTAIESSISAIALSDLEGDLVYVNKSFLKLWGYESDKEVIGRSVVEFWQTKDSIPDVLKTLKETGAWKGELIARKKDGSVFYTQLSTNVVVDDTGKPIRMMASFLDVTEHKRFEKELKDSEMQYRRLFESAKDGILILDAETGQIVNVNPFLIEMLGYSYEEFLGKKLWEIGVFKDIAASKESFMELQTLGYVRYDDLPLETKDGRLIRVEFISNVYRVDSKKVIQCSIRDVTLQKRAEEALRESEEKYRNLYETMAQGVIYQDANGRIVSANPAAERILGLTPDQMQGRTSVDPRWRSIHEDGSDFPGETHPAMVALKTGRKVENVIMGVFNPGENRYRWIKVSAVPGFRQGEDKPYEVYATFDDVTAIKNAENDLRVSERKFKDMAETTTDFIWEVDEKRRYVYASPKIKELLGYESSEILGKTPFDLMTKEEVKRAGEFFNNKVINREPFYGLENVNVHKDGHLVVLETSGIPLLDEKGRLKGYRGMDRDITERKKAEEELKKYARQLGERVREFRCLYNVTNLVQKENILLEELLNGIVEIIPSGWQYPEITQARIILEGKEYRTEKFRETEWKQSSDIVTWGKESGIVEVYYLEEKPKSDEGPFLKEERNLINEIAKRLGNIIERMQAEKALFESEEKYRSLFENMLNGIALCRIIPDKNDKPVDFEYIEVNDAFEKLTGLKKSETEGKKITELIPGIKESKPDLIGIYGKVALTGEGTKFEIYFEPLKMWLSISAYCPMKGYFVAIFDNVTEEKLAEQAIKESEEKFRNLAEESPNMIFILKKNRILYANKKCEEIIGYKREEFYSQRFSLLNMIATECLGKVKASLDLQESGEETPPYECALNSREGRRIEVITTSKIIKYGGESAVLKILTEITERKRTEEELKKYREHLEELVSERTIKLRESEEKYRTIFENTGTAMAIIEDDDIISLANTEFEKLSGYSAAEIEGKKTWLEFIAKSDDLEKMKKYHHDRVAGRSDVSGSYEFHFVNKQGDTRNVFITTAMIPETKKSVASIIDITQRKKAEEALQNAMDELKQVDRMKDEFFSSVTHEIQNPLTPVKIQSQILLKDYLGELNSEQKESVEMILSSTNRIIRLTDDIMTISKMRAGVLRLETGENNLVKIIQNSVRDIETLAVKKNIEIVKKYPESLIVNCDKDRITQVINNLLVNAIKFTPENGKIIIEVKKEENEAVVSVKDTGIGISKEDQKKLFLTFFQVSSKYGGTGLGLTICKSLIEAHHGRIWVESELLAGSKFSFSLPLNTQPVN